LSSELPSWNDEKQISHMSVGNERHFRYIFDKPMTPRHDIMVFKLLMFKQSVEFIVKRSKMSVFLAFSLSLDINCYSTGSKGAV